MAEEHRCQAPRLCANNCGFFGSPATQHLCSRCYRDLQIKEDQSSNAKFALNQTLAAAAATVVTKSSPLTSLLSTESVSVTSSLSVVDLPEVSSNHFPEVVVEDGNKKKEEARRVDRKKKERPSIWPNRCLTCRKRVGLTGFKCRCGMIYCGSHRYPEQHGCTFDFKSMGKEQIAKANPVVKANKLEKI